MLLRGNLGRGFKAPPCDGGFACGRYYEVSKCAPQYALRHLAEAFKEFFKSNRGFPKFKKKGRNDSFTLDGSIQVDRRRLKVPVIGWLKTYEQLPFGVKPKTVTIVRQADRWFVSFKIEVKPQDTPKLHQIVGVDLGIKALATLSTGESIEGAKSYRKAEHKLSLLQYYSRNQVKGSNNWKKAQIKIARIHRIVANIRKDTLHKLTSYLAKNHSLVAIEDLNVSGMMSNHKLTKAIADMGFYEFRRQLTYKCQLYGSQLVIIDRWLPSSKTCSGCASIKNSLCLSERVYKCDVCSLEIGRDLNAALNIASYAVSSTVKACGEGAADGLL